MRVLRFATAVSLSAFALLPACRHEREAGPPASAPISPSARLDTDAELRADLAAPRDPADGGGTAWIDGAEASPPSVPVDGSGRFTVVYEAGELGVAVGGAVYFMPPPFWGWSSPQTRHPRLAGFTRVSTTADGVELTTTDGHGMLVATVGGRPLRAGERVVFDFGCGDAGATPMRYADSASRLWVAVDGDGDGVRRVLGDSPAVAVRAGPPARVVLNLPSVARPGQPARLTLAVLDAVGNAGVELGGRVRLEQLGGDELDLPGELELSPSDRGVLHVELAPRSEGVVRVQATLDGLPPAVSNPMLVAAAAAPVYWADLHGHCSFSDGSGTPEDYLRYARDVAGLDVAALTDHDHWGVRFLDQTPELWQEVRHQTARFYEPGRFVTLLGFEWTSWVHGHRHVLYFAGDGEVLSSVDDRYDTPPELWAALTGRRAMSFAHHSAGGPVATNWEYPPDPELEPCTEVCSVHGASEAMDAAVPIYHAVPGNFVRDQLVLGYRLGFVASGDGHDGHPGLAHLGAATGGVAAIVADELSRDAVYEALRARRVYATSGPRILLRFAVDGHPMGSLLPPPGDGGAEVYARVLGTAPIARVELVADGKVVAAAAGDGGLEMELDHRLTGVGDGSHVYLRVTQADGAQAWSSPVFFGD